MLRRPRCVSEHRDGMTTANQGDRRGLTRPNERRRLFLDAADEGCLVCPPSTRASTCSSSTVHGGQGDTAVASVVGRDVDAARLCVGLTRGPVHNVAVVVARTDTAARGCLADSIQRGTPELTMQDAVRAAQQEVRRAASKREAAVVTGPVGEATSGRGIGMQRCSVCEAFSGHAFGPAIRAKSDSSWKALATSARLLK